MAKNKILKKLLTSFRFLTQNRKSHIYGNELITLNLMEILPMRWIYVIGFIFIFFASSAQGFTMYVNDVIKITMRTGPGISHKVIEMPQSGQPLEVLESKNEWSHVRLPDGRDGWVLKRFLTSKKPKELRIKELEQKYQKLSDNYKAIISENEKLKKEKEELARLDENHKKEIEELAISYKNLETDSKDYLKIKAEWEKASAELKKQKKLAEELKKKNDAMEWKQNIMWFLSGAGVFLMGFLIGGINEKRANKRVSYY